eukprot:gene23941-9509_t
MQAPLLAPSQMQNLASRPLSGSRLALPCRQGPLRPSHSTTFRDIASQGTAKPSFSRRGSVAVEARGGGRLPGGNGGNMRRGSMPQALDRAIASVVYLLPFFNSLVYGRFLMYMYPAVRSAMSPIMPIIQAYNSIPFGSLVVFFGIYLGIVNNKSMSRFARFNGMQAILLDICLVLPRLVETIFTPPTAGWGLKAYVNSQSFIWIFISFWVVFGIFNCIIGVYPRIPFIADAADPQVM